ncbi:MAG: O-antigen ligase family protein [Bacteroidota bacterium]
MTEDLTIPLSGKGQKSWLSRWLYRLVITEKLMNLPGMIFMIACASLIAIGITGYGSMFTVAMLGIIVGLPILYAIVCIPSFGVLFILVMAYSLFGIMRLGFDFPVGTIMDGIEFLLLIGLLISPEKNSKWSMGKDPVSIAIWVWIIFNLLELLNPVAISALAWLYTIRSVAFVMVMYFVFRYRIRTLEFVRLLLNCWLLLSLLAALYAFKQEYIGFSSAELEYLHSDPGAIDLLFIDGHWRKFSFLSDPVAFAYNMVISSILAICMAAATKSIRRKIVLIVLACVFLYAMSFSGTRGAYVLIPVALLFYTILNFNKWVLVGSVVVGMGLAVLIFMPTSNPTLYRFQTAFKPTQDASYILRQMNQAKIKPYIMTHPMGGGLGATGVWGQRFAPESFLANFPPDSGFVRVGVEQGWLGLFLFCTLLFVMLRAGIINFFRIRNPELKSYCLAMVLIIFVLSIGNYPQEALVQFPTSIYFYLVAALAGITWQLDKEIKTGTNESDK